MCSNNGAILRCTVFDGQSQGTNNVIAVTFYLWSQCIVQFVYRVITIVAEAAKANLSASFCKIVSGLTTQFGGILKESKLAFW